MNHNCDKLVQITTVTGLNICCSISGGSPYPKMDGRQVLTLLEAGYRMPKPQHVDDKLYEKIMFSFFESHSRLKINPHFLDGPAYLLEMLE